MKWSDKWKKYHSLQDIQKNLAPLHDTWVHETHYVMALRCVFPCHPSCLQGWPRPAGMLDVPPAPTCSAAYCLLKAAHSYLFYMLGSFLDANFHKQGCKLLWALAVRAAAPQLPGAQQREPEQAAGTWGWASGAPPVHTPRAGRVGSVPQINSQHARYRITLTRNA